nr:unnamed protein product [Spirometra erinaceieuropaei]
MNDSGNISRTLLCCHGEVKKTGVGRRLGGWHGETAHLAVPPHPLVHKNIWPGFSTTTKMVDGRDPNWRSVSLQLYLVAHRTRLALAKRLQEEKEKEDGKTVEVSEEAVLSSGEETAPPSAANADEGESEVELLNRPDALWRRKSFANTWWRHGLV